MLVLRLMPLIVLAGALLNAFQPPYPVGNGVSAPAVIYKTEPQYSQEAREAHVEGEVWLSVIIDERGIPGEVSVTRSLEPSLDEKAVEAIRNWRFKPGMKDGAPVSVRATISVLFKLL